MRSSFLPFHQGAQKARQEKKKPGGIDSNSSHTAAMAAPSPWSITPKSPTHSDLERQHTQLVLWIGSRCNPTSPKARSISNVTLDSHPHHHAQSSIAGFTSRQVSPCSKDADEALQKLCKEGRMKDALCLVDRMVRETTTPRKSPKGAYICLLKACTARRMLTEGKQVHALMLKTHCDSNLFLANNLIDMYSKCGSLVDACAVFNAMPRHNVFSWTAIISAFVDAGKYEEAIHLFKEMQKSSIAPDKVVLCVVLRACARAAALEQGRQIHSLLLERGLERDTVLQNILIHMYAKCGCVEEAREVLHNMSERNVFSWSTMIAGYAQNGHGKEALAVYEQMKQEGVKANEVTCACVLRACASIGELEQGKLIHALVVERGFDLDMIVQSTLVDMYAKCGCLDDARALFDRMSRRDAASWNAMIAGYAEHKVGTEAIALYGQMKQEGVEADSVTFVCVLKACANVGALEQGKLVHSLILEKGIEQDMIVANALVDMYAKCGCVDDARRLFDGMSERDVASWNAVIAGYARNEREREAVALYERMKEEGMGGNKVTFASVLRACASLAALGQGKQVHSVIVEEGLEGDVVVANALVDMYAKCGCLEVARQLFDSSACGRDVVLWNTMIAGYGQNGMGKEALALFKQMEQEPIEPDDVTYICVLSACSHCGLVDEGFRVLNFMYEYGGVTPTLEHYSCMVDLLGRAGMLAEAAEFIKKMPLGPNIVVWMSLLGAARKEGNAEVGQHAFDSIMKLEPRNAAPYVPLADIYAAVGRIDKVAEVRKEMMEKGFGWREIGLITCR